MHDDVLCEVLCVVLVIIAHAKTALIYSCEFNRAGDGLSTGCRSAGQLGVLERSQRTTVSPDSNFCMYEHSLKFVRPASNFCCLCLTWRGLASTFGISRRHLCTWPPGMGRLDLQILRMTCVQESLTSLTVCLLFVT